MRFAPVIRSRVLTRIISVLAVLATLELCCRAFAPSSEEYCYFHPEYGRVHHTGLDQPYHSRESHRTVRLRTNSFHHRGAEPVVPKPEGVRRIAVFGDSFTAAVSQEESETFCGLLEQRLNRDSSGCRWEVWNFGMTATSPAGQLFKYERLLDRLEPDIALVMFNCSDIIENLPNGSLDEEVIKLYLDQNDRLQVFTRQPTRAEMLKENTQLYIWQKKWTNSIFDRFKDPTRFHAVEWPNARAVSEVPESELVGETWRIMSAILSRFQDATDQDGVRFGVVGLPLSWQIYPNQFSAIRDSDKTRSFDVDQFDRRLAETCRRIGVPHRSMTPAFRDATPSRSDEVRDEWLYFDGHNHLNNEGCELVADEMYQFLNVQGWIDAN